MSFHEYQHMRVSLVQMACVELGQLLLFLPILVNKPDVPSSELYS